MHSISSRSAGLLARSHDPFTSMKLLLFIVIEIFAMRVIPVMCEWEMLEFLSRVAQDGF